MNVPTVERIVEQDAFLEGMLIPLPPGPALSPERRLMLAVLQNAVDTWQRYRRAHSGPLAERAAEARVWFAGAPADFTFVECCSAADLDPDAVREALARGMVVWERHRKRAKA